MAKDEYSYIYGDDDDDDVDWSEIGECEFMDTEDEIEERINGIRGTIGRGDCLYCYGKNSMKYEPAGFFYCDKCKSMTDEDFYYRWCLGYPTEIN